MEAKNTTKNNAGFEFLYLSQEDVIATGMDMAAFIEVTEEHFRLFDEQKVTLPPKVVLDLDERKRGRINALTAYVGGAIDVCGIKWVASFPGNPERQGIPRANALIILNDSHIGTPLAVMDGTYISAMRTGAVTGVGVKYLGRKQAEIVALIGCGVQAQTQLLATDAVLPHISEVRCFDVNPGVARGFAKRMARNRGLPCSTMGSVEETVTGADIIITATVADEPIVKNKFVKQGSLFVHVGSYQEEEEEVVLASDKIIVDDWESVNHRRTPILARMYEEGKLDDMGIYANLGEIVSGKKAGRESDEERIFLLPIGMGSEDVIAAFRVYQRALERKLGKKLRLWNDYVFEEKERQ